MEHDLGTTAVRARRASVRDGAIVTEPTSFPRPLTVSTVAAGVWILRIVVEGKSTHCGNRPLAIRPGGPGDEIGVNALEKALDVVERAAAARGAVGDLRSATRASRRGSSRSARTSCTPTRGCPFPAYFPNRAAIEYVIWYPPQESAEEVAREIEEHVLAACRLDTWLRDHPPAFEWLNHWPPMETPWEHELAQTMARGHEAASGERVGPPSPEHPVNFGAASDGSFYEEARASPPSSTGRATSSSRTAATSTCCSTTWRRRRRRSRRRSSTGAGRSHDRGRRSHTPGHPGPPPGADSSAGKRAVERAHRDDSRAAS